MKRIVSIFLMILTLASLFMIPAVSFAETTYIHPSFEKACDTIRYYILQWKKDPGYVNPHNFDYDFCFYVKYRTTHVNTETLKDEMIREVFKYTGDYYKGDGLYCFIRQLYMEEHVEKVNEGYIVTLDISGNYDVSRSQIQQINKWVENNALWLATKKYGTGSSEYGKALWIYKWIINNCKEDNVNRPKTSSHNAYAAKYGVAVCDGFAHLYYMMAVRNGLNCRMISRYYNSGGGHCWCVVQINSKWYFVDPMKGSLTSSGMKKFFLAGTRYYDSSSRPYDKNEIADTYCGWQLEDRYVVATGAANTSWMPSLIKIEKNNYK